VNEEQRTMLAIAAIAVVILIGLARLTSWPHAVGVYIGVGAVRLFFYAIDEDRAAVWTCMLAGSGLLLWAAVALLRAGWSS
jgi:hypothetical protein